jgi:hypothetical protein
MKKLLTALILLSCSTTFSYAQHRHNHHYYHKPHGHYHNHSYVVPALIVGGLLGAAIANNYQQPTPTIVYPHTYNTYETVIIDGIIYRKQIVLVNGVYREILIR